MRFDLDAEQLAIRDAARALARDRFVPVTGGDPEADDTFWPALTASGWTQLAVPRRFGGDAGGILELCLVLEELGHALAPGAFFANACAGVALSALGADPAHAPLDGIASGARRAAFGARTSADDILVLGLTGAGLVVVLDEDGASIGSAPRDAAPITTLDVTRTLHAVRALADAERVDGDVTHARDCVEVLVAAELVGVAQHAMELAVAYASERTQFGRPIGAYQAVSHRCADMLVAVESARSAMLAAAWTADQEPAALPFAASVAKVTAAHAAWSVSASALQVHGGIGFTWEHPIHRFLRRAAVSSRLLASSDEHLDRVAAQHGLASA